MTTRTNNKQYYKEKYRKKYLVTSREMIVKIIILRIISSILTASLVYFFTGSWYTSAKIMWIDFVIKTILYYTYEYEWFKLRKLWQKEFEEHKRINK